MLNKQFYYGKSSKSKLSTTKEHVQKFMYEAIEDSPWDFGVSWGRRDAEEQNDMYNKRDSKGRRLSKCDGYIKISVHQYGEAVDIAIYVDGKITWDKRYYYALAGHILGTAKRLGVNCIWGGDWDGDGDVTDQTFNDLCHYEFPE